MRVLILSASYGSGHNAAAHSLAGAFASAGASATIVDHFGAHNQWIAPRVDRYCVAAEEVKHEFVARGIAPDRVVVTGVPVRADFETPVDSLTARRALGLSPDLPVVLAMAGAQGSFGRL